jgi:membrane protease YdiL (CAAX protease family)
MLFIWFAANFVPHGVIYLLTRKLYFQLDPLPGALCELSIMLLNLCLPILVLARSSLGRRIRDALGWHWRGWRTLAWGMLGVSLFLAVTFLVVKVVGSPSFPYGQGIGPLTLPQDLPLVLLMVALWLITTLGEEIMFRGYMQTGLTERYGLAVGLLLPALLWGLRHHPADLYWGWGAPMNQWLSRLGQLYLGALIFGLVRHWSKSTTATWIAHLLLWLAVIIINAMGAGG